MPNTSKPSQTSSGFRRRLGRGYDKLLNLPWPWRPGDRLAPTAVQQSTPVLGLMTPQLFMPESVSGELGPLTTLSPAFTPEAGTSKWVILGDALERLQKCPGLFHPLEPVIGTLRSCLSIVEVATKNNEEHDRLAIHLTSTALLLTEHLEQHRHTQMSAAVEDIIRSIENYVRLINTKKGSSIGRRLLNAQYNQEQLIEWCENIDRLFQQLQAKTVLESFALLNEQTTSARLKLLNPARLARYDVELSMGNGRRRCTTNTRTTVLQDLDSWAQDLASPPLSWMSGLAGTGKTTVTFSFSKIMDDRKQLAASFFCSRVHPECREPKRIIPTIAYQLAKYSPRYQSLLCATLGGDPDVALSNIPNQFEKLLREPLARLTEEHAIAGSLLIVIDALDECEDATAMMLFLESLVEHVKDLPLKVLVTSRPEPEVYYKMKSHGEDSYMPMHLHELDRAMVQKDIQTYLQEELKAISPTPDQIQDLVGRCGALFIYAATVVRYVRPGDPRANSAQRLQEVLAPKATGPTKKHSEIDSLYSMVIDIAFGNNTAEYEEMENMWMALWTILCARRPIDVELVAVLSGINSASATLSALQPFRSVLHMSEENGLISIFHASFPDFMFDQQRSNLLHHNASGHNQLIHNQLLARKCFQLMEDGLRFNICGLQSSYVPDKCVDGLGARIHKNISPSLSYACRYWGDHLWRTPHFEESCKLLENFLSMQLLFWMEVLNLKQEISKGAETLIRASTWLDNTSHLCQLASFVEDAGNFVTSFAANAISQCTPHIYISLLPFCPQSSAVSQTYHKFMRGLIEPGQRVMQLREVAALASWQIKSEVFAVAYSHDGTRIAFGCLDASIGIQNAHDGAVEWVLGAHNDHSENDDGPASVCTVAFSPDDSRLAAGLEDFTVRVYDTRSGTLVLGPLHAHTDMVTSVAFSFDGAYIISGSADCTIQIRDADQGAQRIGPLTGHTDQIWSIAVSPTDRNIVASGSDDHTIRVWDLCNGTPASKLLRAHTAEVNAVAFSPDGTRMASGSCDRAICVWDPHTGTLICGPFKGHEGRVTSLAYSPSGKWLASGSFDRTVRVWDPMDGALLAGPYQGHTGAIQSVAFSPDGTRIISGSLDNTIRVWDPRKGVTQGSAPESHIDSVTSVAFSPDGKSIASCSRDGTVRLWGAHDGMPTRSPLRCHDGLVLSVSFSPDGTRLATSSRDRTVRVWNLGDLDAPAVTCEGHKDTVWSVSFSPDSATLASAGGGDDREVIVWDSSSGSLIKSFAGHEAEITSVAFSPAGECVASGSHDKTVRLWGLTDGAVSAEEHILAMHSDKVWTVAFSPDGRYLASGSTDKTICVWDRHHRRPVSNPFHGHTERVLSVAFSPDGAYIASGSDDKTVRVCDAHSGVLVAGPFVGHAELIWSVAFSPHGNTVASGSLDGTIRVWNLEGHNSETTREVGDEYTGNSLTRYWELKQDGWLEGDNKQLLWVPREIAHSLLTPQCNHVISTCGALSIGFDNLLIGEEWHKCFGEKRG